MIYLAIKRRKMQKGSSDSNKGGRVGANELRIVLKGHLTTIGNDY